VRGFALTALVLGSSCLPRLAVMVRAPAKVPLGPVTRVSILTFDSRLGIVMRERVKHDLGADRHFTVVPMCGERSCEPVEAFVRLYERDSRVIGTDKGNALSLTVETDVATPEGRSLSPKRQRTRNTLLGGEGFERIAERAASDIGAEVAAELVHPTSAEFVEFDDAAPFKLGIKQATEGRLGDARRTFQELIVNNPKTAGAYFNLAIVQEALGDDAAAKANYEKAISLANKDEYTQALARFVARQKAKAALLAPPR
jgi:hypothetical protein